MSTETPSDDTSTTTENSKTEIKANNNKIVFAPLGKYAAIAVIMVSIIVTTAIMLNKQVNTIDEQITAIKNEVSTLNTVKADATMPTDSAELPVSTAINSAVKSENTSTPGATEMAKVNVAPVTAQAIKAPNTAALFAVESNDSMTPAKETMSDSSHNTEQASPTVQVTTNAPVKAENTAQARQSQHAMDHQARIEAYKLEHKQRMAEMFARIKSLESQQLDHYKARQEKQIVHLRERITQQQQLIESLTLRNKELFELRSANVQRNQTRREQLLNRI